jgi:transposase-like protein
MLQQGASKADRQFIESYSKRGYNDEIKQQCLTMYVNGIGFRAIERLTGVNHNTLLPYPFGTRSKFEITILPE